MLQTKRQICINDRLQRGVVAARYSSSLFVACSCGLIYIEKIFTKSRIISFGCLRERKSCYFGGVARLASVCHFAVCQGVCSAYVKTRRSPWNRLFSSKTFLENHPSFTIQRYCHSLYSLCTHPHA